MNALPKNEQLSAMVDGTFYNLLRRYITEDPSMIDIRKYITVTHRDMEFFLEQHPEMANACFDKNQKRKVYDDNCAIAKEGNTYLVFWLDHGRRTDITKFKTMYAALAEFLFWGHGVFNPK